MCAVNETTYEEMMKQFHHHCLDCDARLDDEGYVIEMDDCYYSPKVCNTCGYRPCDNSC